MAHMNQQQLTSALLHAYQFNQPLSMFDYTHILHDFDSAYQVQQALNTAKREAVAGYKLGITSKIIQTILGTPEPFYGQHMHSHVLQTPAQLQLDELNQPMIGITLIFIAKTDLYYGLSDSALLHRLYLSGGIEITDSRFMHWFPTLNKYLMLADNCLSAYAIYGQYIDGDSLTPHQLAHIQAELTLNEQRCGYGGGTEQPLHLLQWLLKKLQQHHLCWRAGQIVSSGSLFMPVSMSCGDYCAHFDLLNLAHVWLAVHA